MLIWIDLGNSPHVPFFLALSKEFERRGHKILWTAREYAQTVPLAKKAGLPIEIFGAHGGKNIFQKGIKFLSRTSSLLNWARGKKLDLVVSHNSYEPLAVAQLLGIRSVTLMDYEHHPLNHLSFRLAKKVIVPESFPRDSLQKFGAHENKTRRFPRLKEDVYLADFAADPNFKNELDSLGISSENILVVVRPPALEALYHRQFSNELFDVMLDKFAADKNVKIVLLPRKDYDGATIRQKHPQKNIIIPTAVLDGADLIAASDFVISGGGTMNREAAALGVPVATIFAGKPAAIDEMLIREGRMQKLETAYDLEKIKLCKKGSRVSGKHFKTKELVADLILEE